MTRVFKITQEDIDRSDTLEQSELGKWAYVLSGVWYWFDDQQQAEASLQVVGRDNKQTSRCPHCWHWCVNESDYCKSVMGQVTTVYEFECPECGEKWEDD